MSHKRYQPILPCGNKMLQKRWDDTYYQEHKRRLKSAKPMVDTKPPICHPHVQQKQKKQQMESERTEEIDRDNINLLRKMQRIMKTQGGVDHRNTYTHHSLNSLQRQREIERVTKENEEMLKRLQKVQPQYRVSDWVDDWTRNAKLTEMITAYPEPPKSQRDKRRKETSIINHEELPKEEEEEEQEREKDTEENTDIPHTT